MNDTKQRPTQIVCEIRSSLSKLRMTASQARRDWNFAEQLQDFEGLATCGISALHNTFEQLRQIEISIDDTARGPHLRFSPRGIGTDSGIACFVCGEKLRSGSNIAAFTSQEHGKAIVAWFSSRAGGAWLDFRPTEPNWVQVKVLCCQAHLSNLEKLLALTGQYGIIREKDIDESMSFVAN